MGREKERVVETLTGSAPVTFPSQSNRPLNLLNYPQASFLCPVLSSVSWLSFPLSLRCSWPSCASSSPSCLKRGAGPSIPRLRNLPAVGERRQKTGRGWTRTCRTTPRSAEEKTVRTEQNRIAFALKLRLLTVKNYFALYLNNYFYFPLFSLFRAYKQLGY